MGRKTEVPITKEVLEWALVESGLPAAVVSEAAHASEKEFNDWLTGNARPSLTQMKAVAAKLHRQLATFLLPQPPEIGHPQVEFRNPLGQQPRPLNPTERRYLRRARRLQDAHAWLSRELGRNPPDVIAASLSADPERVAGEVRSRLDVPISRQLEWRSASVAFDAWRSTVEQMGITVVLSSMGEESCRGFSLWNDVAPLIAVNTAWKDEARIFTLFHEMGHLVTRTNSACGVAPTTTGSPQEPAERWCETFAAGVVIPADALRTTSNVGDLRTLLRLAGHYKVSLRAMAIRLIGLNKSDWSLYRAIPGNADTKREGGAGGTGRNRREIREDELGRRGMDIFVEAVRREVISESQALDYLDIPVAEFDRLAHAAPSEP